MHGHPVETRSSTLKQKAYRELKEFSLIALYLWVVLGLFTVYKSVILREHHIDFAYHGFAVINALALGKVMLIAQDLHLGDRFRSAPLIYPTLLKSALFSLLLAACKILEDGLLGMYRGKSFQESLADLGGGTWSGLLILTMLLCFMLVPFFAVGELKRVLGQGTLQRLFFRSAAMVDDRMNTTRVNGDAHKAPSNQPA